MADDYTDDQPQVLIVVQGGVVTEVFSDEGLKVLILDLDTYPDETLRDALEKLAGELTSQALSTVPF
jgi:hypothetical protein